MLNYSVRTLSNGTKLYIVPKKGYAEKKAMVAFNFGSCDTEFIMNGKAVSQPSGTAHFLEHKMFDGSQDLFSEFEGLGASANAFTNFSTTAYHFSCTDNFKNAFALLLKMVSSLDTTEESVEREKKIIGQEIKMYNDDIGWQVYFNGLKAAYSENRVRNSVAGTLETISDIHCEDLYTAYDAFYTGENCCIIAAGDIEPKEIAEIAEKNISLGSKTAEKKYLPEDSPNNDVEKLNMDVPKDIFNIDFRESIATDSISKRIALNEILLEILCGKSSHLCSSLTEKGLISDGLTAEYLCGKNYGLRIIGGESENTLEIAEQISREVERYVKFGICEKNLKRIKRVLKARRLFQCESLESICCTLADCFAKGIEVLDIYGGYDIIKGSDVREELKAFSDNNRVISKL